MLRLGIAPQQLKFWKYSSWSHRYKKSSRSVFGWNVDSPRQPDREAPFLAFRGDFVVTPDGLVYSLKLNGTRSDGQPMDLSEPLSFGGSYDNDPGSLVDVLQHGLYEAMRGN